MCMRGLSFLVSHFFSSDAKMFCVFTISKRDLALSPLVADCLPIFTCFVVHFIATSCSMRAQRQLTSTQCTVTSDSMPKMKQSDAASI